MTKSEREDAKNLARILYMQGLTNKEIAQKAKVSENSVSKWVKDNGWDNLRAAQNVTRTELVNKILRTINDVLDRAAQHPDELNSSSLTDQLCKLAATIEKIEPKLLSWMLSRCLWRLASGCSSAHKLTTPLLPNLSSISLSCKTCLSLSKWLKTFNSFYYGI